MNGFATSRHTTIAASLMTVERPANTIICGVEIIVL
jgi:hypothetical protein